jgi:putative hydrolases of HD superfamily
MIQALIELQRLKRLDRTGWVLRGIAPGAESVAAHSYGVALAAMLLADEMRARGHQVDVERVVRMALLHDAAEVRVGDLPRTATGYFGSTARREAEQTAFHEVVETLSSVIRDTYEEIHKEYEQRSSLAARIVKGADLIDLLVQALAFERSGVRGLGEFWAGVLSRDRHEAEALSQLLDECFDQLVIERRKVLRREAEIGEVGSNVTAP